MPSPISISFPASNLPAHSPFLDSRRCPTHIAVDGYGTVPIHIYRQGWFGLSRISPDAFERILHTRPVRAEDMLHPPEPMSHQSKLTCLAGITVGAMLMVWGAMAVVPLACGLGAAIWLLSAISSVAIEAYWREVDGMPPPYMPYRTVEYLN